MTTTVEVYDSLRNDADGIVARLDGVSHGEALQALLVTRTLTGGDQLLWDLVFDGSDGALLDLERIVERTVDDLAVLRRVIDHARTLHGIELAAPAPN